MRKCHNASIWQFQIIKIDTELAVHYQTFQQRLETQKCLTLHTFAVFSFSFTGTSVARAPQSAENHLNHCSTFNVT